MEIPYALLLVLEVLPLAAVIFGARVVRKLRTELHLTREQLRETRAIVDALVHVPRAAAPESAEMAVATASETPAILADDSRDIATEPELSALSEVATLSSVPNAEPVREPDSHAPPALPVPARPAPRASDADREAEWENWLGGRATAVFGGIVLALAGLLLFRYSIEHQLVPPWLRVGLGFTAGISFIALSEWVLRARFPVTANPVAGGGTVVLYATAWAAHALYGLLMPAASGLLMAMTTVCCCALSWRYDSIVIALIGVVGGFLTPLAVSTGSDNAIGLFGYLFLLDAGLLYLARRRGWWILAALSLGLTTLYEIAWVLLRLTPGQVWLALIITPLFGLLFAAAHIDRHERTPEGMSSRFGGFGVPLLLFIYFAARADLTPHLYPLAMAIVIPLVASVWLSNQRREAWLGQGAVAGAVVILGMWWGRHRLTDGAAWEFITVSLVLACTCEGLARWRRRAWAGVMFPDPALLATFAIFALSIVCTIVPHAGSVTPWLSLWLVLTAALLYRSMWSDNPSLHLLASAVLTVALIFLPRDGATRLASGDLPANLLAYIVAAIAFQAVSLLLKEPSHRTASTWAAGLMSLVLNLCLGLPSHGSLFATAQYLLAAILLGVLTALAGARAASSLLFSVAGFSAAWAHSLWVFGGGLVLGADGHSPVASFALAAQLACVVIFTWAPFPFAAVFRSRRAPWIAAALSGVFWFYPMRQVLMSEWPNLPEALLPLGLAALALAAASATAGVWPRDREARLRGMTWYLVVALCGIAVAMPLQLERHWTMAGWALEGAAIVWLWRRIDDPALKYLALVLLGLSSGRLLLEPFLLDGEHLGRMRILNWLAYTYLVPAAALFWSARILSHLEMPRLREWEMRRSDVRDQPIATHGTAAAAIAVVFWWLNLAIADWFSPGSTLDLSYQRMPARDLTISIAWGIFALGLLGAGLRLTSRGLRWLSLVLLLATIGKVFLYDLGELRDLYRVASLLALAASLIVVSLVYQRYLLGTAKTDRT